MVIQLLVSKIYLKCSTLYNVLHPRDSCSLSHSLFFKKSPTSWRNDSCLHYFNLKTSVLLKCVFFPFPCRCWLHRRQIDGSLNRTPSGFYDRVWQILERTPNGLIVAGNYLPQVKPHLWDSDHVSLFSV